MRTNDYFDMDTKKNNVKKNLRQVMAISLCSVLLCVSCFVGTGWAWFKQNVEVAGNVIVLAEMPEVVVAINEDNSDSLGPRTHTVTVKHAGQMDDFQQKSVLYVTFIIDGEAQGYVKLDAGNEYSASIQVVTDQDCNLTWEVSWDAPTSENPVVDGVIRSLDEEAEPEEESTEASEPDGNQNENSGGDQSENSGGGNQSENSGDGNQSENPGGNQSENPGGNQSENPGGDQSENPESGSQEDTSKPTDNEVTTGGGTPSEGSPTNSTEETE